MTRLPLHAFLALGIALSHPAALAGAPPPTLQAHCRTLPAAGLMTRAIEVLLDHQYVIRSAESSLGIISFTRVFQGRTSDSKHIVKVGGSMLVTPQPDGTAVVRMLIHQEWMDTTTGSITGAGVETDTDASYYKDLLDDLEQRTAGAKPQARS
ncbi:hypothetical protein [Geothrix sp. 21YS21S-2]|uniref:hypothetical protein n=1 Tax=Geothrix sp. 21YS21S-2 TaxID=3068893 RepID=UPI0027B96AD7|nr:hypothetical protein [Geothrix sp. 21YS21S-2]